MVRISGLIRSETHKRALSEPELNKFLWECGVNFVSDWAILNDTRSKQLKRILAEFHHLSEAEIHLACVLLESYHAVYRRDRLEQRRNQLTLGQDRIKEPCLPPTATQLHEIAQRVNAKAALSVGTQEVVTQLQNLAKRLQDYRLYVRKSLRAKESLNEPKNRSKLDHTQSDDSTNNGHVPFVQMYAL